MEALSAARECHFAAGVVIWGLVILGEIKVICWPGKFPYAPVCHFRGVCGPPEAHPWNPRASGWAWQLLSELLGAFRTIEASDSCTY